MVGTSKYDRYAVVYALPSVEGGGHIPYLGLMTCLLFTSCWLSLPVMGGSIMDDIIKLLELVALRGSRSPEIFRRLEVMH